MPELPEVETVRRQLESELKGKRIVSVDVRFAGRLNVSATVFQKRLAGATLKTFGRRAKLLLLGFSNGWTLVVHLKMTGKFLIRSKSEAPTKHDHVVFHLADKRQLFFRDVRKFGYLKLVPTKDLAKLILDKESYGPEPLDPGFTYRKFRMCLTGSPNKKLKPLLMDQTCIAGLGNIYADEACWFALVRPTRKVGTLTETELKGLYRGALGTLKDSLKHGGTSADDFLNVYGQPGGNEPYLAVYGRTGEKCRRRDGGVIEKIWIGARSAHFCPKCQK
jgi:formamidopyrimidine-DNA glycosylase